jgi:vancomycin resistance protein YoaR
MEKIKNFFAEKKVPFSWRRIWVTIIIVVVMFGIFFTGLIAYAFTYNEKVLPGVRIADISIGGMERTDLKIFLQDMTDKMTTDGIKFIYSVGEEKDTFTLFPSLVVEGDIIDLASFDVDAEVDVLLNYKKEGGIIIRSLAVLSARVNRPQASLKNIYIDEAKIIEAVEDRISEYETESQDSNVEIISILPLDYNITEAVEGIEYKYSDIKDQIISSLAMLKTPEIIIEQEITKPEVLKEDLESVEARLPAIFSAGALQLTYTDPQTKRERNWSISLDNIKKWIEVQKEEDNGFGFGLDEELLKEYLEANISSVINIEARDAKFEMNEHGRVVKFQGSRPGLALNLDETYSLINDAILQRSWHDEGVTKTVQLIVEQTEPNIKTGEINDLGISEPLGTGISDYSGSPLNRRKNMLNAVQKLNGIIIQPGEEFSTITYTKPFTIEGGYFPELVIKGDEIKPEIGGGLCQVGTTLFRMAMNSGMPITQRRNHSLVVSYYNDPVNNLPGTDATVYDPSPDFKFLNDTGHAILIQTFMDATNSELVFTLWGTSDGRKGYFTHPVVHNWIGAGEKRIVESEDLASGEEKCQHAYTGANTSFTYTRVLPDGELVERVFESHYRALPQICLIGQIAVDGEEVVSEETVVEE